MSAGNADDRVAIDALWRVWLESPDEELWGSLTRWGREALRGDTELSLVAWGRGRIGDWRFREALVGGASRAGHPLGQIARDRVVAEAHDRELVEMVCGAALAQGASVLAEFCARNGITPADPVRCAVFFLLTCPA